MADEMRCYVCDGKNWHSMGKIHRDSEMMVCKTCGNVVHKVTDEMAAKMRDYYRREYRPAPNHMNIITTTHKRLYIAKFLNEFLNERDPKKGGGRPLICGDVGCATGYIPAWLRSLGHKAYGSELAITFRRFAETFYGLPVPEDLEPKHKYDLISIYHVLEHLPNPDKELEKYRDMLADDGHMLVSTPEWFDTLEEASGSAIQEFEHLFHKDHINVFSSNSLKNIFSKVGLEIVKEDHLQYGQTYLLKKGTPSGVRVLEPWEMMKDKIERSKRAINFYRDGKLELAVDAWKRFPEAWIAMAHGKESKDPDKQADIFQRALAVLSDNMRLLIGYATWLYMGEKVKEALSVYKKIAENKPNETLYIFMGYCFSKLGDAPKAIESFYRASEMNPQKWTECMDQICGVAVRCPCYEEVVVAKLRKEAGDKAVKDAYAKDGPPPAPPVEGDESPKEEPKDEGKKGA